MYSGSLAAEVKALFQELTKHASSDERIELWKDLMEGYCEDCGEPLPHGYDCFCQRDD